MEGCEMTGGWNNLEELQVFVDEFANFEKTPTDWYHGYVTGMIGVLYVSGQIRYKTCCQLTEWVELIYRSQRRPTPFTSFCGN
jgi:hypothetical protein